MRYLSMFVVITLVFSLAFTFAAVAAAAPLTPRPPDPLAAETLSRAAILGHELQHACEVAASPADDATRIRQLFEGEGRRHGAYFETGAAVMVEKNIRKELCAAAPAARALQAQPVAKFDH